MLPRDVFWLSGMTLFSGVAVAARDDHLIRLIGELIEPCADLVVTFGVGGALLGSGHHWLGVLDDASDRPDRALEHFAEAIAIATRIEAPYWVADAMVGSAHALRRRGRRGDAAEIERLEREARSIAEQGGYGRVLAQLNGVHTANER